MSRTARLLGATAAVGLLWPMSAASAHAFFIGTPSTLPVNTQQALVMNVPHEMDDTNYNVDILVAIPNGWAAVTCQAQATWSCSIGSVSGHPSIHFVKASGAAPLQDETFRFTVRTASTAGSYAFPTVQTYVAGEVVRWIGVPSSANPAPVLKTVGSTTTTTQSTTTTRPRATTTTQAGPPPTVINGGSTSTTTNSTVPGATTSTVPSTTTTIAVGGSTTSAATPTTASGESPTTAADTDAGPTDGPKTTSLVGIAAGANDGGDDGGSNAVPIVVIGLLVLATGGFFGVKKLRAAG